MFYPAGGSTSCRDRRPANLEQLLLARRTKSNVNTAELEKISKYRPLVTRSEKHTEGQGVMRWLNRITQPPRRQSPTAPQIASVIGGARLLPRAKLSSERC